MTVPLALDLAMLPVALVGGGAALVKRLTLLDGEAVPNLAIFVPDADMEIRTLAGDRLVARLPTADEIAACRVLFVAGLPNDLSANLAAIARAHRVLVNVEDTLPLCDFHVPAILRRGALAISLSTGGASPTLARRLRGYLGTMFPPEWDSRIARIAAMRQDMRRSGASMAEVAQATDALIDQEDWLPPV